MVFVSWRVQPIQELLPVVSGIRYSYLSNLGAAVEGRRLPIIGNGNQDLVPPPPVAIQHLSVRRGTPGRLARVSAVAEVHSLSPATLMAKMR